MPKTLHRKIRNLEDSITRDMNPALEKAQRTKAPLDCEDAILKVTNVIVLAKRLRLYVERELLGRRPAPPAAAS